MSSGKVGEGLRRHFILIFKTSLLFLFIQILSSASYGNAAEIANVNVRMSSNEIYVTSSITPAPKLMEDLNEGLTKEFAIYIDLFRAWGFWPDEFVLGKKMTRILRSNQIKREYVASSLYGNIHLEKRFKDIESMVVWAMNIGDIKLSNIKELDPGNYFVKVTIESRARKLPPVIGHLLFFVPEKEFSVSKNSQTFQINNKEAQ